MVITGVSSIAEVVSLPGVDWALLIVIVLQFLAFAYHLGKTESMLLEINEKLLEIEMALHLRAQR